MAGLRRDRNHEKLSEDYQSKEIEMYDVLNQVHISEKRNVVEMFSSFGSKINLCGRLNLLIEDIYLCLDSYLSKEKYVIRRKFERQEYDNDISLKHQLYENGSLLYIREKIEHLKEYMNANASTVDDYEDDLKSGQYEMPFATVQACKDYLTTLQEMNRRADAIIAVLHKLRRKAVETKNAIAIYNIHLIEYYNEMKEAGRFDDVQSRGVTKIEIFGNDGEIYTAKFRHEGANAELVFDQVDLQLETILGDEE